MVSRQETLAQSVLSVTAVFSCAFLYMIVDPHTLHSLFRMERSIDSLFYFLYLSVMTATPVDYGDILSPTAGVKVVVMSQKVVCYLTLSTLIGLIVSWAGGHVDKEAGERRRR